MNKIYNKALSIQVSLNGLSFCIKNQDSKKIEHLSSIDFEKKETPFKILDYLEEELDKEFYLNQNFKDVLVIHRNELSTIVPKEFFDEDQIAEYLKFNAKILRSDYLTYDSIDRIESVNVYVPLVNVNNLVLERFGEFVYKHSSTILIEICLAISSEEKGTCIFLNVQHNYFEMLILEKNHLIFYNIFEFATQEDLSYYVLFTMEQLNLSAEKTLLRFVGGVNREDENFAIIYKYVRDVDILNLHEPLNISSSITTVDLNTHSILLNSFSK